MATMPCLAKIPVPYADKLLQDLEEAGVALKEHHSTFLPAYLLTLLQAFQCKCYLRKKSIAYPPILYLSTCVPVYVLACLNTYVPTCLPVYPSPSVPD